ncbi:DUF1033 family protein [Jeotgalibacillus aurantiacus]|uniref:DUF1033 family protein n=1 Tax=Jeotgalibacillus aurantiacus TaxID=2763266 RepID=UPI001D0AFCED|nr:DUF1033 family protein [Jeotgalibacillus aurantiacus]
MWRIIQLKSDAEPWWFLEGWEQDITQEWNTIEKSEAFEIFRNRTNELKQACKHVRVKRATQFAYWNDDDFFFCEDCDDDLQIYYGLLILHNDKPYTTNQMNDDEKAFFEKLID